MSSKRLTGEVAQLGGVAIEFKNVCFGVQDRLTGSSLDILKNVSGKVCPKTDETIVSSRLFATLPACHTHPNQT